MTSAVPQPGETFQGEDGTVSTILAQNYDPNYNPTEEELRDYAEYIGIDVDREPYLLPIAKEGLRCPLPDEWRACQTNDDEIYYFNFVSGESLWDHPMDDVYKQKVIEERKRHKNGGSKRRQSGDTSMNSNNANENNPERSRTNSAVATSPVVKSGTTKALSEALLSSTSRRGSALPPGPQGRLGSLTGGESAMPSSLGLAAPFTGGGGLPFSSASPTTPVTTMKDKEERTRRRIMEELAAEKRQHTIELERRLTEERSRLENEVKEKRAQTNDAWELYKKKLQSGEAAAEEAARMEATWKTRIAEETAKVKALETELQEKQKKYQLLRTKSADEVKKTLEEENRKKVEAVKEERLGELEKEMKDLEKKLQKELEEFQKTIAADEKRKVDEAEGKKNERLKELDEAHKKELKKMEDEVAQLKKRLSGNATPAVDDAAVKKAKEAADKEVEAAKKKYKDLIQTTLTQYTEKEKKLQDSIASQGKPKTQTAQSTPTKVTLTAEEKKKLEMEEEKLKKQVEEAKRIFNQQTDALLAHRRGVPLSQSVTPRITPLDLNLTPSGKINSLNNNNSNINGSFDENSLNGSGRSAAVEVDPIVFATQELKAKEAEMTTYILSLKQLEAKHEMAVKQIRDDHKKKLDEKGKADVRRLQQFTKEVTERKRVWLQRNPAPSQELPQLEEVPKLMSVLGDISEVEQPSEEEKNRIIDKKLKELRQQYVELEQKELAELEKKYTKELETLKETYYNSRLKATRDSIDRHREESIRSLTPPTSPGSTFASSTTNNNNNTPSFSGVNNSPDPKLVSRRKSIQESIEKEKSEAAKQLEAVKQQIKEEEQKLLKPIPLVPPPNSQRQTPLKAAPRKKEKKKKANHSSFVASSIDSISPAKAAAEEGELHVQWKDRLSTLKRSIQNEINRYEELLKKSQKEMENTNQNTRAASVDYIQYMQNANHNTNDDSRLGMKRPPAMSVGTLGERPPVFPQSHNTTANNNFFPARTMSTERFTSPQCQSQSQANNNSLLFSASPIRPWGSTADSLYASPMPHFQNQHNLSLNTSSIPTAELFANTSFMPPSFDQAGYPTTNPSGVQRDYALEQRLQNVRDALHQRKTALKEKQTSMESMRAEWKADMRACKASQDVTRAAQLKLVKEQLETMARELNKEVTAVKEAAQVLKGEEMRYEAQLLLSSTLQNSNDPNAAAVTGLLHQLLERTETLEKVMRKSFLVESQPHPDRRSVDQRKASSAKRQPSKEHARALHFHHSPDSRRTSLSSPAKQTSHHAREEKERRRSTQEGSSERKPSKTTNENPPIEKRSDAAPTSAASAKKEEYVAKPNSADNINQHLKDISSWLQDQ